jgi:L-rhamnose mutarotase
VKRFCLALDLKDDPLLISEYKRHHENVWPEVRSSIVDSGIRNLEIYLLGNRLFMIIETSDDFSFENKATADEANAKVQEWEKLMWHYQQALPQATNGEKWLLMDRIYSLTGS